MGGAFFRKAPPSVYQMKRGSGNVRFSYEYISYSLPVHEFYKGIGRTAYHAACGFAAYPLFGKALWSEVILL